MAIRPVDLIVMKDAGCPLLKQGDRVIVNGSEVRPQNGARVCLKGLCTLYPQVQAYLKGTPTSKPLLSKQLYCTADGCQSVFEAVESRGESKVKSAPPPPYTDVASAVASAPMPGTAQTMPASPTPAHLSGETGTVIMHSQKGPPFMQRVPPNVQVQLTLASKKMPFADGEIILRDGVMGEALYIVADGEVEVVRPLPDQSEQRIAVLGIGECFGEMSLITQQPTTARVRARRGAVVFQIVKNDVQKIMRTSPDLQTIFTQMLADRIRAINVIPQQQAAPGAPPAAASGISGKLSLISMIDLVQTLRSSRRSGTLTLKQNNQEATVTFKDGQVFAAQSGKKAGEEAFFVTVSWAEADFHFQLMIQELPPVCQIKVETMSLLMEALRRMDESKRR
jgi:CRP-like cAMP-binding protein